jgi:hypothetical protein
MKNIPIIIGVAVIVGVGGFLGGMKYQATKNVPIAPTTTQGTNQTPGQRFGNRNANGLRPTLGQIISADDKSVTVKMQDGSSKIILLSDKTQISKSEKGVATDLEKGVTVAVVGITNSDGSVTAETIQINPQMGRLGFGRNNSSPTPSK